MSARRRKADLPEDGYRRVAIETVSPEIDGGRYAAKGIVGDLVEVEADAFVDGHDQVACVLLYRSESQRKWREAPMEPLGNDRWRGRFPLQDLGLHHCTIEAWVDPFRTWRRDMAKWLAAGKEVAVHLEIGAQLVGQAAARARGRDAERLTQWAESLLEEADVDPLDESLARLMGRWPDRRSATRYDRELPVVADRERARFS